MSDETQKAPKQPDVVDVEVGGRIRTRRRALGITQKKLAESVGVTFQQIQKYEQGTNRVGASRILQVAKALAVPVSFFFHSGMQPASDPKENAEQHPYADLLNFLQTSEGLELNNAFAAIKSLALRGRVVALVRTIAETDSSSHGLTK